MASKPNPSWSEPQKRVHKDMQEATEVIVPYFGPEIPRLDNHSREQVCDMLGVIKQAKKAVDKVETILKERFKVVLDGDTSLRTGRFEAAIRTAPRVALNQEKVKALLQQCDDEGINLERLIDGVIDKSIRVPNEVFFKEDSDSDFSDMGPVDSNMRRFMSETNVDTLTVKAI